MSKVTNVILVIPDSEPEERIEQINAWLASNGHRAMPLLRDFPEACGGNKILETDVYVGAFNKLDVDGFVGYVRGLAWVYLAEAQLFVRGEEDPVFVERMMLG